MCRYVTKLYLFFKNCISPALTDRGLRVIIPTCLSVIVIALEPAEAPSAASPYYFRALILDGPSARAVSERINRPEAISFT